MQLTLLDLWGMPIEEPVKKKKTAKKGNTTKRAIPNPKPQVTAVPPVETDKTVNGNKETKSENTVKQSDPDDIYATLDWETNPPINGFYEMMMGLTPERRKELRRLAAEHQEKQRVDGTDVKAAPAIPEKEARKQPEAQQEVTPDHVTDNNASVKPATSLFPEFETEKPKEEPLDLSPRPFNGMLEPHHRDGSMVLDASRNLGYLKDITPYGATFQPLDLTGYQKEKAMLYVSLRDTYERLYNYEAEYHDEGVAQREALNTCYDEFVMRYGNLNAKQNVKLVMMDAGGLGQT